MNIDRAKNVLLRRQTHLLRRLGDKTRNLSYDKRENQAISVVLLHMRKLEAENEEYKKPVAYSNHKNQTSTNTC